MGNYEVLFGDWHKLGGVEAAYERITASDVQRVMKQYLIPTNRTVAILVPTAAAPVSKGEGK